jgi:hypothetical protein
LQEPDVPQRVSRRTLSFVQNWTVLPSPTVLS